MNIADEPQRMTYQANEMEKVGDDTYNLEVEQNKSRGDIE